MPHTPLRLTDRQSQVVEAVGRLTKERGYAPSLREVAVVIGVHPSRAARLARVAVRKGALRHAPGVARSYRVVEREATP